MALVMREARSSDWDKVAALLTRADLPLDGAQDHLASFVLAEDSEGTLHGVAGLELYGASALLRSVAARDRGQGVGTQVVQSALDAAKTHGVKDIVLLTTTAEAWFPRFGFHTIARGDVPAAVQQSVEFQSACPDTATVMLLRLA